MIKLIVVASVAASLLLGCDQGNTTGSEKAAKALVDKSVSNMVPVQGGEFLMGDFMAFPMHLQGSQDDGTDR